MRYDDGFLDIWLASECLERFSDDQKQFWKILFQEDNVGGIIERKQVNPMEIKPLLPYIWMAKVAWDENDVPINVELTLLGTGMARIYGERTGQDAIADEGEGSFKQDLELTHRRMFHYMNWIKKYQKPLYACADKLQVNEYFVTASMLLIPMRQNSNEINMVVGLVDLIYEDV